jgi:hypothetical protein
MSTALKLETAQEYIVESPLMEHPQVRALINSVMANKIKFNELERELFKILVELFEQMLKAVLERMDDMITHSAARQGWEIKDTLPRTLDTLVGGIRYKRRYYRKLTATGEYIYSFLLDEILGIEKGKNISPRLREMAATLAAENSYRKSSGFLKEMLNVSMSHETIRQEVQAIGEHIAKWDKETGVDGTGTTEVPLLVIEVDGAGIKRQERGRPKKKREEDKNFELKTAVIYEGWQEKFPGEYKLKNPTYFVYRGEGKEFWAALERQLGRVYCLEGCGRVIVGGDGAAWIRNGAEELGAEYQYCRFHLERDMRKLFQDMPEIKESLRKTMEDNDREAFNMVIDAILVQNENQPPKEKLAEFKTLINSVWEGITDWRKRGRPVPEEARGLGVIEPNIGHTIARRFKHRGASWTPQGAINLAKVRCAVRNGNLIELMRLPGPPPAEETGTAGSKEIYNSYWFKRQADGMRKTDPADWCRGSMPGMYGPSSKEREIAKLISRLTLDWLF